MRSGELALAIEIPAGFARDIDNLISDVLFEDVGLDPAVLYPTIDPSFYANGLFFNVPGKVQVRGFELTALADLGNGWTGQASYTNTKSETDSSNAQLARIPKDYLKAAVSYESPDSGWGADASLLYTGEQRANVSGFGSQNYGDYTVVDLAAHVFIDWLRGRCAAFAQEGAGGEARGGEVALVAERHPCKDAFVQVARQRIPQRGG